MLIRLTQQVMFNCVDHNRVDPSYCERHDEIEDLSSDDDDDDDEQEEDQNVSSRWW